MPTIAKDVLSKRIIAYELVAFVAVIALIWLDELIDLPYVLLGAEATLVNWRESIFETVIIIALGLIIVRNTGILFGRLKYLEGFLAICSSCKKIRDEHGKWQQLETYIRDRSEARFSHGICPHCAEKLYPEVFKNISTLKTANRL
ncbi:MAG: hypothetical protein WBB19_08040 [Desulforhopalus sp.]